MELSINSRFWIMALWKAREGEVHKKNKILDSSFKNKSWILDHGIVEGKRREV